MTRLLTVLLVLGACQRGEETDSGPIDSEPDRVCSPDQVDAWAASEVGLPVPRESAGFAAARGRAVVVGGWDGAGTRDTVFVAEAGADGALARWNLEAPLPAPREHLGLATTGSRLVAIGGDDDGVSAAQVWVADVGTDASIVQWRAVAPLPAPVTFLGAAAVGDVVVAVGGLVDGAPTDAVWVARLVSGSIAAWEAGPSLPVPLYGAGVTADDAHVYVVGGASRFGNGASEAVLVLDVVGGEVGTWSALPALPETRLAPAVAASEGVVWVAGGLAKGETPLASVRAYRIDPPAWLSVPELPATRFGHGLVSMGDTVLALGGWQDFATAPKSTVFAATWCK